MKIDMSRVCSITRLLLCIAFGLSLIGASSVAKADDIAYMVTGGGSFGTIDLTTGVYTQLGLTGRIVQGLVVKGTTLYAAGAGDNNQDGQLWSVDPANGLLTAIGQPTGIQYQAFGSLNNTLYALDHTSANPNLYSINSSTGAATLIGHLNIGPLAGYYSLSTNSTALYFQLNSTLYTLNTTTGQASPMGALGGYLQVGAMVEVGGKLYAGQDNTSTAPLEILALNKSTGAATVVSNVSGAGASYIFGLAPKSVTLTTTNLFAQVALGGGYTTVFSFTNTGSTEFTGNLILKDNNGQPLAAAFSSPGHPDMVNSAYPLDLLSGGSQEVIAQPQNSTDPTIAGWASVESSGGSLGGVATFQFAPHGNLQTIVGVLSAPATSAATIPIDDDHTVSRDTGFAVANTGATDINIKIIFVNPDGTVHLTLTPQELNPLHPGWHVGGFFWQEANDASFSFQGSVVLIEASGNTFSVVALVLNKTLLTAVPVIQGSAPGIH